MFCFLSSPRAPFKEAKDQRGDQVGELDHCKTFPSQPLQFHPARENVHVSATQFPTRGTSKTCLYHVQSPDGPPNTSATREPPMKTTQ